MPSCPHPRSYATSSPSRLHHGLVPSRAPPSPSLPPCSASLSRPYPAPAPPTADLFPQCSTIGYSLPFAAPSPHSQVFLCTHNLSIIKEELGYMRSTMQRVASLLPEDALAGLISFGMQVQVHKLAFAEIDAPDRHVSRDKGYHVEILLQEETTLEECQQIVLDT